MKRKEEIDKEANSFANTIYKEELEKAEAWVAFRVGAEWADRTILNKAIKFFQSKSKYGMIEENINVFIDEFCKIMEE